MQGDVGPSEILILEDAQEEVSYFYSRAFFVAMNHISEVGFLCIGET